MIHKPLRWYFWAIGLALGLALAISGGVEGGKTLEQARGVRSMLQGGIEAESEGAYNPIVCLRRASEPDQLIAAAGELSDEYLLGAALCMAGEREAGMAALREANGHANAMVQYASGLSDNGTEAEEGARILKNLGLEEDELTAIAWNLVRQENADPYPFIRLLAAQANEQDKTWMLWLDGYQKLAQAEQWQAALDWLKEGAIIAPDKAQGSLYVRMGRIYETVEGMIDYPAALEAFNRAIERGGWIYTKDEANAHLYRGEIYMGMKDQYSPEAALAEFKTALALDPGNYWARLAMGHVYFRSYDQLEKAEGEYRRAMEAQPQTPHAYYYLGEVYRARGEDESAVEWYRKALEKQADFQPAIDRLAELEGK